MPFGPYESFADCVSQNQGKDNPEAFCAWLHHEITGEWPSEVGMASQPPQGGLKMERVEKSYTAMTKTEDDGSITATISTEAIDRDNEVILGDAMKTALSAYLKHPVLLASHDYGDLRARIGKILTADVVEGRTIARIKYFNGLGNALADWGYTLAQQGEAAYSVGFMPKTWKDGTGSEPRRSYSEIELLEVSQVSIPSNREALIGVRARTLGLSHSGHVAAIMQELQEQIEQLETLVQRGWVFSSKRQETLNQTLASLQKVVENITAKQLAETSLGSLWAQLASKSASLVEATKE